MPGSSLHKYILPDAADHAVRILVTRHGADIHELLSFLDLRDAVLVGQSMGASSIWAFVDLFGTDRIAGLVTIDQTPKLINDSEWEHGFYGMTPANSGTFFASVSE